MTHPFGSQAVLENAWAKVNLALHITGRREDGYHSLDSLVVFANSGDKVSVAAAIDLKITVTGPMADALSNGQDNLVLLAANKLKEIAAARGINTSGAHISLVKRLPVAAGIGGGSADAAATLRALNMHWDLPFTNQDLERIGASLGADIPVCIANKSSRITGIGTELYPISDFPKMHIVLANPNVAISTPTVFENLTDRENSPLPKFPTVNNQEHWLRWIKIARNDLHTAASSLSPKIELVLGALSAEGAQLVRMSGSGATCFGIFSDASEAKRAAKTLQISHPNWWVNAAQTI